MKTGYLRYIGSMFTTINVIAMSSALRVISFPQNALIFTFLIFIFGVVSGPLAKFVPSLQHWVFFCLRCCVFLKILFLEFYCHVTVNVNEKHFAFCKEQSGHLLPEVRVITKVTGVGTLQWKWVY